MLLWHLMLLCARPRLGENLMGLHQRYGIHMALRRQRLPDAKGVQLWMLIDLIVWHDGTGILGGN